MRERMYLVLVAVLAAAVFAGLSLFMREAQRRAVEGVRALAESDPVSIPEPRPVPEVARLLRSLKLITVEVQTEVESSRVDQSWRGDVRARVAAPVRLLYGCDLAGIGADENGRTPIGLQRSLVSGGLILRVPRPVRLAAEVDGADARSNIELGWARFRDLAGEHQLGLARAGLYDQARALALNPAQQAAVEQTTREQLVTLVRAFSGSETPVAVEFVDADAKRTGVAGANEATPGVGGGGWGGNR